MYELYRVSKSTKPSFDILKKGMDTEVVVEAEEKFKKAIEEKGMFNFVYKFEKDKYIHSIAKFIVGSNDNEYMVGVNWDISPIKTIEEKLRKEAELQNILIDISNNYINIPLDNVDKILLKQWLG